MRSACCHFLLTCLCSCGNSKTKSKSTTEKNFGDSSSVFVPSEGPSKFKAKGSNIKENENGGVTVDVQERSGEDSHKFETEDLGFVDTLTGASIKLGMTADEVEGLLGAPRETDAQNYRVYSGLVVQYNNDNIAKKIIVASGNFIDGEDTSRFVTPRGLKISTSLDVFKKIYGEEFDESEKDENGEAKMSSALRAVRFYAKELTGYKYLGESYTKENKPKNPDDLLGQTFIFDPNTKEISVIMLADGNSI